MRIRQPFIHPSIYLFLFCIAGLLPCEHLHQQAIARGCHWDSEVQISVADAIHAGTDCYSWSEHVNSSCSRAAAGTVGTHALVAALACMAHLSDAQRNQKLQLAITCAIQEDFIRQLQPGYQAAEYGPPGLRLSGRACCAACCVHVKMLCSCSAERWSFVVFQVHADNSDEPFSHLPPAEGEDVGSSYDVHVLVHPYHQRIMRLLESSPLTSLSR